MKRGSKAERVIDTYVQDLQLAETLNGSRPRSEFISFFFFFFLEGQNFSRIVFVLFFLPPNNLFLESRLLKREKRDQGEKKMGRNILPLSVFLFGLLDDLQRKCRLDNAEVQILRLLPFFLFFSLRLQFLVLFFCSFFPLLYAQQFLFLPHIFPRQFIHIQKFNQYLSTPEVCKFFFMKSSRKEIFLAVQAIRSLSQQSYLYSVLLCRVKAAIDNI